MGRRKYKAFIPPTLPAEFVHPSNEKDWSKPIEVDTTVDVDKAKGRVEKTSDATPEPTDHFIGVDTTSQAVTITLPATNTIAEGKIFLIKDEGGNAATNNITIATTGDVTIDGNSTITMVSDYSSISVYYNGTEWSIY